MGERLLAHLPRRLVEPRQVERATAQVRRLGGRAVFIGRFTAALRALVPGLAGLAGMPYRTFAAAGGVLWATGFVLLGTIVVAAAAALCAGGVRVTAAGPHPSGQATAEGVSRPLQGRLRLRCATGG